MKIQCISISSKSFSGLGTNNFISRSHSFIARRNSSSNLSIKTLSIFAQFESSDVMSSLDWLLGVVCPSERVPGRSRIGPSLVGWATAWAERCYS